MNLGAVASERKVLRGQGWVGEESLLVWALCSGAGSYNALGQEQGTGPWARLPYPLLRESAFLSSHLFQRCLSVCMHSDSWVFAAWILCFCKAFPGVILTSQLEERAAA